MRSMPEFIVLLVVLAFSLCLVSCGYDDGEDNDDGNEISPPCNPGDFEASTNKDQEVVWINIGPGVFMQGSPEDESGRNANETLHEVTLTRAFEMMKTEVTREQFEQVMDYNPSYDSEVGRFHPVDRVGWFDAIAFANKLSLLKAKEPCFILSDIHCRDGEPGNEDDYCKNGEGIHTAVLELNAVESVYDCQGYRLPTESEWEYAARAGSTTAFHAGEITHLDCSPIDPVLSEIGWYCCNSDRFDNKKYKSQRVCSKAANEWGLYDMSGNLWEWVWDWEGDYPAGPVVDPEGPATGLRKIYRGGSWRYDAHRARSAYRCRHFPEANPWVTGFRLVRSLSVKMKPAGSSASPIPSKNQKKFEIERINVRKIDNNTEEAFVPAGVFTMGCERNDIDCYGDEIPLHEVYVNAFFIELYGVTNQELADYLNLENPSNECLGDVCVYSTHPDAKGLYEEGGTWFVDETFEDRPVINMTWNGAAAYCGHLGKRLPTAAEWEKAAKGANEHFIFPWGDSWIENACNHESNGDPFESGPKPMTTPVGYFDGSDHEGNYVTSDGRSPYGVFDMAGNVWEWVHDYYDRFYYLENPVSGWIDPTGPVNGTRRGLRGGSYQDLEKNLRASELHMRSAEKYSIYFGFRCVRDLE